MTTGGSTPFNGSMGFVVAYSGDITAQQNATLYRLLYRRYTAERGITMTAPVAQHRWERLGYWALRLPMMAPTDPLWSVQ